MPHFETLPVGEAQLKSGTGRRAELIREYTSYIEGVGPGQAGRLEAATGETLTTVRRRLTAAANHLGRNLVVKRTAEAVFFWLDEGGTPRRRRRSGS